jgi:hypothetical protein
MTVICKSDEQKRAEAQVMREFHGDPNNPAHREAAEATSHYVAEQLRELQKERNCK